MEEKGSVEDIGYEVLRICGWQDKGVVALAKAMTEEQIRGNMHRGLSIKYVTLYWTNFDPFPLSHFVTHLVTPLKYVPPLGPPFLVYAYIHIMYVCIIYVLAHKRFLIGSFVRGFCLEGFVLGGFCPSPFCQNTPITIES